MIESQQENSVGIHVSLFCSFYIINLFYNFPSYCFLCILCLLSPSSCVSSLPEWREGEWGQSRQSKYGGPGQDNHTWSVLNWALPTLQNTHSHSILMHPRLPKWMGYHYYNSTVYDSPSLMERLWKIAPWEELLGAKKENIWGDDNTWKGISLKILLVICSAAKICDTDVPA